MLTIKELIKEVEMLKKNIINNQNPTDYKLLAMQIGQKQGIKQAIEAVDNLYILNSKTKIIDFLKTEEYFDWQKLKKLFEIK